MSNGRSHLASLFVTGLACLPPALAWAISTGDIVVADRLYGLFFVEPSSGAQHTLSGYINGHGFGDVTTDASGNVFAIDAAAGVVYKINPETGAPTIVTSGGYLAYPHSIDLAPDGSLFVVEGGPAGGVVHVDATTGTQTVVLSGIINAFTVGANGVAHVAMDDSAQPPNYHLYRLTTGATVRISKTGFYDPRSLATDAAGNLIVSEYYLRTIQRVDPATGSVTLLSSGDPLMAPWGVTLEADGMIILADNQELYTCRPPGEPSTCRGALYRVEPATGTQTIVSEQGRFWDITGVDIYRGPSVETPIRGVSWGRIKTLYR